VLDETTQSHPTSDDEWDLYFYAETQELRHIETQIEAWLGSQPIPKGYVRLFHGTQSVSAQEIVDGGMNSAFFSLDSDFGPAFYCDTSLDTSMLYCTHSISSSGCIRCALFAFLVKESDLEALNCATVGGDQWKAMVHSRTGQSEKFFREQGYTADVVIGCISHNPEDTLEDLGPFEDRRIQYAFRGTSGGILLEGVVQVALFDVNKG
jgi:hypothetical protein